VLNRKEINKIKKLLMTYKNTNSWICEFT